MPATFQEILNSRVLTFIVGEAADGVKSEFSIHCSAISELSKPLYSLTEKNTEGPIVWKDVSKATFERFVQFAYTGDYSIPLPRDRTKPVPVPVSVTASPVTSPRIPNEVPLRKRGGSEASSATAVEPHDSSRTTSAIFDGEQPVSPVLEKVDDDSGTILNYPSISKKHKKKKGIRAAAAAATKAKGEVEKEEEDPSTQTQALTGGQEVNTTEQQQKFEPVETVNSDLAAPAVTSESATTEPHSKATKDNTFDHPTSNPNPSSPSINPANPPPSSSLFSTTTSFHTLTYPLLSPLNNHASTCTPSSTFNASKSYSAILLSHAALYTLASKYLVKSLKVLSLWKLHKTLCVFELGGEHEKGGESVGDITDLARYAYANDGVGKSTATVNGIVNGTVNGVGGGAGDGEGEGEGEGEMRALVCAYLAGHAVVLGGNAGFMDLLAEGGQIVKDFFRFQLQNRG